MKTPATETAGAIELDVKAIGADGTFTGYAATFGNTDQGREIVTPGAFTQSLKARPVGKVRMLYQHNPGEVIGVWTSLEQDKTGLKATGQLILDTARGAEAYALLKAGAIDGLSIGFRTIKDRIDRQKGIRYLEQVDLYEISLVTFPMNTNATVSTVKSLPSTAQFRDLVEAINGARSALQN